MAVSQARVAAIQPEIPIDGQKPGFIDSYQQNTGILITAYC